MRALSSAPVLVLLCSACTPDPGGINIHNADPRAEITYPTDGASLVAGQRTVTGTAKVMPWGLSAPSARARA